METSQQVRPPSVGSRLYLLALGAVVIVNAALITVALTAPDAGDGAMPTLAVGWCLTLAAVLLLVRGWRARGDAVVPRQ